MVPTQILAVSGMAAAVLSAQRSFKILGIFTRLARRADRLSQARSAGSRARYFQKLLT